MRAKEIITKTNLVEARTNYEDLTLDYSIDGANVDVRAIVDGKQVGYVIFNRDGRTLFPDDLAVDEEYRGRGIAKKMYDWVKSLPQGFRIIRGDQTSMGKRFWDKNRGEGGNVWEEGVAKETDSKLDTDYYMNEGCGIFAVALSLNNLGSQIYILSNNQGESWSKSFPYEITHVFVNIPGEGQVDVKGIRSIEDMARDFTLSKGDYSVKGPFNPKEFFNKFMGNSDAKPLYGTVKDVKQVQERIQTKQGVAEGSLNEFSPSSDRRDDGDGNSKYIPWQVFIKGIAYLLKDNFTLQMSQQPKQVKARFIPIDPTEYGPSQLYAYDDPRLAYDRQKRGVGIQGMMHVGKYYKAHDGKLLTGYNSQELDGKKWVEFTLANIPKIAAIIAGNKEGALQQSVAEDTEQKYRVTYDMYFTNREKPLYTKTRTVRAGSEEEAIKIIQDLIGGRNHRIEKDVAEDTVDEMALASYKTLGDFSKPGSFRGVDKRLVPHPKSELKAAKFFEQTPYDFRLFFANKPGLGQYQEYGPMTPDQIVKVFGEEDAKKILDNHDDAITVVYVSNRGDAKVMMTPWIMAHRFGHAIQAGARRDKWSAWQETEKLFFSTVNRLLDEYYGKVGSVFDFRKADQPNYNLTPEYNALFNAIGTQRSSRTGQIRRPYEFMYELFAQYLGTGTITLNPLPTNLGYGRKVFGNPSKYLNIKPEFRDETERRQISEMLARDMELMFNDVLGNSVGQVYVM
jgi:GNAT superfamily N-acetyltransferase